jgi:hypothetical protein
MSRGHGWWGGSLLAVLVVGQVGCAARGRALAPGHPDSGPAVQVVSVAAGAGRVSVNRGGYVDTWQQETGRCTRDLAVPVGVQTFGLGLVVLPPLCGVMSAALPGMTTKFQGGQLRRAIAKAVAVRDLHGELRDAIAAAGLESGHAASVPTDAARGAERPADPGYARPEVILEVTVTEIRVRDDGTVSSLSALVRVLRASDRAELGTSVVTHEPADRASWYSTLDPALSGLATAIVQRFVPGSVADGGRS